MEVYVVINLDGAKGQSDQVTLQMKIRQCAKHKKKNCSASFSELYGGYPPSVLTQTCFQYIIFQLIAMSQMAPAGLHRGEELRQVAPWRRDQYHGQGFQTTYGMI